MRRLIALAVLSLCLLSPPAAADGPGASFSADAVALDGGRLLLVGPAEWKGAGGRPIDVDPGHTRVRLWGILVPGLHERGGRQALAALDALLAASAGTHPTTARVDCAVMESATGPGAEPLALCSAAGEDLGFGLIAEGWALADRATLWRDAAHDAAAAGTASEYEVMQRLARSTRAGLWGLPHR